MNLKNKRIFISGGAGVIGCELVSILNNYGAKLLVGDIKRRPISFPSNVQYRRGDLNYIGIYEIKTFQPDIFIHLAATFERTEESLDFYNENYWNNINLSNRLAKIFIQQNKIKKIIFASSYLVYDQQLYLSNDPKEIPYKLNENSILKPRNLIGLAKFYHENELNFLKKFYEKYPKIVSIRIFRGFGKNSNDIISRWIRSLINKDKINLFRPENIFDFIYSKDTASGIVEIIKSDFEGCINLGSGKSTKISEVILYLKKKFPKMSYKLINSKIKFESSEADISLLNNITKWHPKYSIKKAIDEIIDFEKQKNKTDKPNDAEIGLLVTSSSSKFSLINSIKNAEYKLEKNIKIFAGDVDQKALTKFANIKFWKMPSTEEKNLNKIINYCIKNNIFIIIPTRDEELLFWSRNKTILKKNKIDVLVSSKKSLELCLDKLNFSNFGEKNDLPIIKSHQNLKNISYNSYVVKERYGSGSLKIGLNLNIKNAIMFSKKLNNPIFQKFIPGIEISADIWISKKYKIKGVILRTRDIIIRGESKVTTSIENNKIKNEVIRVVKKLRIIGHVVIQGILDKKNKFNIIECNPRFGGASTLSIEKGLDSFYWSIIESLGENVDFFPFICDKKKITQVRYEIDKYFYDNNI